MVLIKDLPVRGSSLVAKRGTSVRRVIIKFGSRLDLILPLDCYITVKLNQKVVGAKTCVAAVVPKDGRE